MTETPHVKNRTVTLAVRAPRRIGGELFNAESAGAGRIITWNTPQAANIRAQQIRARGFQARVIGNRVYVGDIRKDRQNSRLKPRATYDWAGATAADTQ
jgi:hypothetical protein